MKAHFITYEDKKNKKHRARLPEGRYLDVGEKIHKGDLRIYSDAKPDVVGGKKINSILYPVGYVIYSYEKEYFYRPSKKRAKKENLKGPLAGYRTLKPEEIVQDGDIWFSKTFPQGCVVQGCEYYPPMKAMEKDWRIYKRPPVKPLKPGSRVDFDLSSLTSLKGSGTVLELEGKDNCILWPDKPILGLQAIIIEKKLLK